MRDVEQSVIEGMRSREHLIEPARERLLTGVRRKVRRRRVTRAIGAGTAVLALAGLVAAGAAVWPRDGRPPAVAASPSAATPGWRPASALGAQIEVPRHWTDNDYGCNMGDSPTVARSLVGTMIRACGWTEPGTKELAIIGSAIPGLGEPGTPGGYERDAMPTRPVTVGGQPGTRAEGRLADGRFAGWVDVPGREVTVLVRTHDAALTGRILDSVTLVEVDHAGCPTRRATRSAQPVREPFVDRAPASISVCLYSDPTDPRLQSSIRLDAAAAAALAAAINAAPAGGNPDEPAPRCIQSDPPVTTVVLYVASTGPAAPLWVTFTGCRGRGIDNGARTVHVSVPMLQMMMDPMRVGFGASLPDGAAADKSRGPN